MRDGLFIRGFVLLGGGVLVGFSLIPLVVLSCRKAGFSWESLDTRLKLRLKSNVEMTTA